MSLETADKHRRAANELRDLECVAGVETTADGPEAIETDIVTTNDCHGLPPVVLEILARYGLSLPNCSRQGSAFQAVAV